MTIKKYFVKFKKISSRFLESPKWIGIGAIAAILGVLGTLIIQGKFNDHGRNIEQIPSKIQSIKDSSPNITQIHENELVKNEIGHLLRSCESAYKKGRGKNDISLAESNCFYYKQDAIKCKEYWVAPNSPDLIKFDIVKIEIIDENTAKGEIKLTTLTMGSEKSELYLITFKKIENEWKIYAGNPFYR